MVRETLWARLHPAVLDRLGAAGEIARPGRPRRTATRTRGLGCEHARLASLRTAGPRHPEDPIQARPASQETREGLRHPRLPPRAARAAHRRQDRRNQHRVLGPARPPPLGHRTHHRLARRIPPTQHPIRAPRPPIRRIPRPRRPHLLQETHQVRHALSTPHGPETIDGQLVRPTA